MSVIKIILVIAVVLVVYFYFASAVGRMLGGRKDHEE